MINRKSLKTPVVAALMVLPLALSGCGDKKADPYSSMPGAIVAPLKDGTKEKDAKEYVAQYMESKQEPKLTEETPMPPFYSPDTAGGKAASKKTKKKIFQAFDEIFAARTAEEMGRGILTNTCQEDLYSREGKPLEDAKQAQDMIRQGNMPVTSSPIGALTDGKTAALEAVSVTQNGDWASMMLRPADPLLRSKVPNDDDVHIVFFKKEDKQWKFCNN